MVQRFTAERQILAGLKHRSIVHLVDAGSTIDGRPFFVMELVDGGLPLDEYARRRSLSVGERVELFVRVCSAVEYAHRNLVVHRDLKPSNVLVTPDGEPKLLDFGLAKLVDSGSGPRPDVTVSDERFMTPQYASPEQVRGEPVLPASDIYTLGVMLFELLTGERPYSFTSGSPTEIERVVCEAAVPRPSAVLGTRANRSTHAGSAPPLESGAVVGRQLEGDLDAIVLKALRKQADGRYGSVEALSQDLRRHLAGLPVSAHAGSTAYRARKFVRRHGALVGASAAVLLAITGGLIATAWQAQAAAHARDDANAQRSPNSALRTCGGSRPGSSSSSTMPSLLLPVLRRPGRWC